ncbi:bile acid:sodium symporter family protein [Mycobacterium kiyosense]|uniref:Transporter n=1 Tax=Mycobacterium kiyosense TaxID=2871094 RepID=A0A9P3Q4X3_9MYCO|nr:bile acid:sodium symporter family protein [Mycobacterium kiyosense]BDE15604.1 transporter [Mycobacterium sp. 20KCMC460]BDB44068.1 transporter [Mycobacterium kiyosense]GLB80973.1 transporter [Mycobacterium kiyosense]GLB87267.1 transporter [Mycobacterium kiyosense]GLB93453.1 transporter [Mycobacterium kiyosense]
MDNRYFPLVVAVVMLALGLTLTIDDFRRAATLRRPLAVALICQALLLPALCLLIAEVFALPPNLAVGLMLMAATPGGTTANILSHLFNGDLALNLTLTAINAVLSIVAVPVILAISMTWFLGDGRFLPLQWDKFLGVFGLVFIPTTIGVFIRHRFPELARRLQLPIRIAAALLLVLIIAVTLAKSWGTLSHYFGVLSGAVATFCVTSLTVGYLAPRLMRLAGRQAIAMGLEVGMHNGVLAMGIALSPQLLNNAEMAIPAAVYGIIAIFIALAFIFTVRRLDPSFRDPDARRVISADQSDPSKDPQEDPA